MICKQFYDFKNSDIKLINYTQLFDIKYSYVILIIYTLI